MIRARELRREQTDAERVLWRHLRGRRFAGSKFRRQHPIGPYFADFASPAYRLVVELDGGQHVDRQDYDRRRTRTLEQFGWRVLRFWDDEVLKDTEAVLESILRSVVAAPHPGPLPASRGEGGPAAAPHPGPLPARRGEGAR